MKKYLLFLIIFVLIFLKFTNNSYAQCGAGNSCVYWNITNACDSCSWDASFTSCLCDAVNMRQVYFCSDPGCDGLVCGISSGGLGNGCEISGGICRTYCGTLGCCMSGGGPTPVPTPTSGPDPTPTPTPTPVATPRSCVVQGVKVVTEGGVNSGAVNAASNLTVNLNNPNTDSTANPYAFVISYLPSNPLNRTISVPSLPGYRVMYSVGYKTINAHDPPPVVPAIDTNSLTFSDLQCDDPNPANRYVDLWWHYYPLYGNMTVKVGEISSITTCNNIAANLQDFTTPPGAQAGLNLLQNSLPNATFTNNTITYISPWIINNIQYGSWTANAIPPTAYVKQKMCLETTEVLSNQVTISQPNQNLYIGFLYSPSWYQVLGGNMHADNNSILDKVANTFYMINPISGYPKAGIASYNQAGTANFGTNPSAIPTTGYLVQDARHHNSSPTNYSNYLRKFENKLNIFGYGNGVDRPNNAGLPNPGTYTAAGDLTISGDWDIGAGDTYVIFVQGNLIIDTITMKVPESSFLAFIVSGNITVKDSVGFDNIVNPYQTIAMIGTNITSIPNIQGVFIADQEFLSSDVPGTSKQLVVAGTVVANSFNLRRNLGTASSTYPAEMFIYRADLWRNMPKEFMERDIYWQEVNP